MAENETDWKSMAYSLIPAGVGLLTGGGLGAVAGFGSGVGALAKEQQEVKEYNDQLAFKRAQEERAQKQIGFEERKLSLADQEAARQAQIFEYEIAKFKRESTTAQRQEEAAREYEKTLTDPRDIAAHRFNPAAGIKAWNDQRAEEKKKEVWVRGMGPVLDRLSAEGRFKPPRGMTGAQFAAVAGEDGLKTILDLEKNAREDAQLGIQREELGLRRQQLAADKTRSLGSIDERYFILQDAKTGRLIVKDVYDLAGLPPDYASRKTAKDAMGLIKDTWKAGQANGSETRDFPTYLSDPKIQQLLRVEIEPNSAKERDKLTQMVQREEQETKIIDKGLRSVFGSGSEEKFAQWKASPEGRAAREKLSEAARLDGILFQAPSSSPQNARPPTQAGAAPAAPTARSAAPAPTLPDPSARVIASREQAMTTRAAQMKAEQEQARQAETRKQAGFRKERSDRLKEMWASRPDKIAELRKQGLIID